MDMRADFASPFVPFFIPCGPEMIRTGAMVGRSDFFRMGNILDAGLWEDPLLDPQT
jgi:hypothetical protein